MVPHPTATSSDPQDLDIPWYIETPFSLLQGDFVLGTVAPNTQKAQCDPKEVSNSSEYN